MVQHKQTGNRYPFSGLIVCEKCGKHFRRKTSTNTPEYSKPVWMCSTFNAYGKAYCDAQQIPEKTLIEETCKILNLTALEGVELRDYLQEIRVPGKNTLVYVLKDGVEKRVEWQHRSRRDSWTPEMKEQMRQKKLIWYQQQREKRDNNGS